MTQDKKFVDTITQLQDQSIITWKNEALTLKETDFLALVEQNHSWNFQLWLAEDSARREDKGFEFVYQAKRTIDHCNQQRNNLMEKMDEWFVNQLNPSQKPDCAVHSETPGMIIDRLSILALKLYHMHLQLNRNDASMEHRQRCEEKYHTLQAQRQQLSQCLSELLTDITAGLRTFRVYHQFKMYNDPNLNPELYNPSK